MLFDDTVPVGEAFETQVVNLGGETQVLDDLDFLENMDTQFIDEFDDQVALDSDGEGTDGTEVLGDSDELSDYELGREGKCELLDREKIQCTSLCEHAKKGLTEQPNALIDNQHSSGGNNALILVMELAYIMILRFFFLCVCVWRI